MKTNIFKKIIMSIFAIFTFGIGLNIGNALGELGDIYSSKTDLIPPTSSLSSQGTIGDRFYESAGNIQMVGIILCIASLVSIIFIFMKIKENKATITHKGYDLQVSS